VATSVDGDIEHIPDADLLTREFYKVPDEIDPESQLEFSRPLRAESVAWRKYASDISAIHEQACKRTQERNELRKNRNNMPPVQYVGTRSITAGAMRAIKSEHGHGFEVTHCPERGDRAHAHIVMLPSTAPGAKPINTNDRRELVSLLYQRFGELEQHTCPNISSPSEYSPQSVGRKT
jgi:hypothetical protein